MSKSKIKRLQAQMKDVENYALAKITFIDRDSNKKNAITYPITDIELVNLGEFEGKKFTVENGKWKEID